MPVATAINATLTITPAEDIRIHQGSSYAAWYTNFKVLAGTYPLTFRKAPHSGYKDGYVAEVDAEVTDDYYASHFGGVPFGKYDTLQNAGKREKLKLFFTTSELLIHTGIEIAEESYADALELAKAQLEADADLTLRCINSSVERNRENGKDAFDWISGHAVTLTEQTKALSTIYATQGRRAYNASEEAKGRTGWKEWDATHVPKTETKYRQA